MTNIQNNKKIMPVERLLKYHVIITVRGITEMDRSVDTVKEVDEIQHDLLFNKLPEKFGGTRDHINKMAFIRNMLIRDQVKMVVAYPGATWGEVQTVMQLNDQYKNSNKTVQVMDLLGYFKDKDTATQELERLQTERFQKNQRNINNMDKDRLQLEILKIQQQITRLE